MAESVREFKFDSPLNDAIFIHNWEVIIYFSLAHQYQF